MKSKFIFLILFVIVFTTGCGHVKELAKTFWGSSTRVLDQERVNGIKRAYQCQYEECFDTVLLLTEREVEEIEDEEGGLFGTEENDEEEEEVNNEDKEAPRPKLLELFIKNREKRHIVVMGVPGAVDTTEVGIFFIPTVDNHVRIEISSLSSSAKKRVAEIIFTELDQFYQEVK